MVQHAHAVIRPPRRTQDPENVQAARTPAGIDLGRPGSIGRLSLDRGPPSGVTPLFAGAYVSARAPLSRDGTPASPLNHYSRGTVTRFPS